MLVNGLLVKKKWQKYNLSWFCSNIRPLLGPHFLRSNVMQYSSGPLRRQLCTFVLFALQPILRASLPACPQTAAACGSCADKVGRRRRRRRSANSVQQDGGRPGCPPFAAAPCTLALQCVAGVTRSTRTHRLRGSCAYFQSFGQLVLEVIISPQ